MIKNIALHIGAHKTATTYIVNQLIDDKKKRFARDNICTIFKSNDISALVPGELRWEGISQGIAQLAYSKGPSEVEYEIIAKKLDGLINSTPQNNILISEENLIGTCRDVVRTERLYHNAVNSLSLVKRMLENHNLSIFFSVRETSSFLTSAYCEAVRGGDFLNFRQFVRNVDHPSGLWYDLLLRIKSIFNGCPIYVWDYKSVFKRSFMLTLLKIMFRHSESLDFLEECEFSNDIINPSMDSKALKLLELASALYSQDELAQLRNFLDTRMRWEGREIFCEWSKMESDYMAQNYLNDIASIKADSGFIFLD